MSLLRDAACSRGHSVELLDLDKASPTVCRIIPGREGKFVKKSWCEGLVKEAKEEMRDCKADLCLGDGVGLITEVSKEIAASADATIVLSKNGSAIKEWVKHYKELGKPILATVASKVGCPAGGEKWNDEKRVGVACGLDRAEYKSGKLFPGPTVVGVAKTIEERYGLKPRPGIHCPEFKKILEE